jgi:hypothetical protein
MDGTLYGGWAAEEWLAGRVNQWEYCLPGYELQRLHRLGARREPDRTYRAALRTSRKEAERARRARLQDDPTYRARCARRSQIQTAARSAARLVARGGAGAEPHPRGPDGKYLRPADAGGRGGLA